jgi:hypothetical protein
MMIGAKQGDSRVQALLEELELKYDIDSDGDFRVGFELDDGRTQLAFIRSETTQFGKFDIREIFSVAHISEGPLDGQLANALLIYNAHVKLGSWRMERQDDDRCIVAFAVQIAANTDATSLYTALRLVIDTADDIERKLDEEDQF